MSPAEVVHPVPVGEVNGWSASMRTTFLEDPAQATRLSSWMARIWDENRTWGARADGRWVATLRTKSHRLTVPGTSTDLPVDGLTAVTVAATHRRQGLLRAMLTESLSAAAERGDAASILIAAEWPIYGRFGYAPATQGAHYTLRTRGARLLDSAATATQGGGSLRQVDASQLRQLGPAVFARARLLRAGNIDRDGSWWDRELGVNGVSLPAGPAPIHIVYDGPDGVDGYLSWTPVGEPWDETAELGHLMVPELIAATEDAYRGLWQYLLGMDVVADATLRYRPVDEPLPWLLADGRALRETYRGDRLWLRLLDVPAALSARRYAVSGTLVMQVSDDDGNGSAAGRYQLTAGPDGADCVRTGATPELHLSPRALASAYLGGFSLTALRSAGLVEELRAGALARADSLFATPLAPWCGTGF